MDIQKPIQTIDKNQPYLSIVVPCFNEEDNVKILHEKILAVCKRICDNFEIIFIDDGSTDNTLEELKKLTLIKIIKLRKNFGQTSAMDIGLKESNGQYIITMDGDLQNDPEDIVKLLNEIKKQKCDIISGWRKNRQDSINKKLLSRGANFLRKIFIDDGIHDSGCTLKIYKRECIHGLNIYGEMHRFIPAILKWKGYKIGEIEVNHYPRIYGQTKYNWKRTIKGFLDILNLWFWKKYHSRPLHLFGGLGILFLIISFFTIIYAVYLKIFQKLDLSDTALTIVSVFFFLSGVQLLVSGVIADILIKIYYQKSEDKPYLIEEIITK